MYIIHGDSNLLKHILMLTIVKLNEIEKKVNNLKINGHEIF